MFKSKKYVNLKKEVWRHRELYLFLLPAIALLIIFNYVPIYGALMAFQDVKIGDTFGMSEWIGLYHFKRLFNSKWFPIMIKNVVSVSLLSQLISWPLSPILAILLHNSTNVKIKKAVQNITYIPYLFSVVIVISIFNVFCSGETGIINILLMNLGYDRINFFGDPDWVYPLYIIAGIWRGTGYGAIVYLGALSAVDEEMIEAARVDGAGILKCIWHIQIPTIMPTIVTMLILSLGHAFSASTDTMLLLQTDLNLNSSEIIGTYVYKSGVLGAQYGFSTAAGLFENLVNLVMLLIVNFIARKVSETSIL